MGKAVTKQDLIGAAEALGLDLRHARHVERDCRFLFSRTSHLTGLTSTAEAPLRVAAMLLGAPAGGPSGDRHRCRARLAGRGRSSSPGGGRGRASLAGFLKGRFPKLAAPERRIVANVLKIYRNGPPRCSPRRHTKPAPDVAHEIALRIAAILFIVEALDHSGTEGTRIVSIADDVDNLELLVSRSRASRQNAAAAFENRVLWNAVALRPICRVRVVGPGACARPALILPGFSAGQALRRILRRQL